MAKTATITAPKQPKAPDAAVAQGYRLRIFSGHSALVLDHVPPWTFEQARSYAEGEAAQRGVWVSPTSFWPAHTITSITLEPITP